MMSVEARAALGVDPSLADAHAVLAMAAVLDYEWQQADHAFELALSTPPVQPLVRCLYSVWHLAPMERMREAEAQMVRSLEEDPLNIYARVMFGDDRTPTALREPLRIDAERHDNSQTLYVNRLLAELAADGTG